MASTRHTRWVVFAFPRQFGGTSNRYYTDDGTITTHRWEAARFYSAQEASAFADSMSIDLTARAFIGQEDFTEFELNRGKH